MTLLQKYAEDIFTHGEDKPSKVRIYDWALGLIAVVTTDKCDRLQFVGSVTPTVEEALQIGGDAFLEFTKKKTDLEKWCNNKYGGQDKSEIYVTPALGYEGLYTAKEVEEIFTVGHITVKVDCWQHGDALRHKDSMDKVIFNKFSKNGWFYAMREDRPFKCCNYIKVGE